MKVKIKFMSRTVIYVTVTIVVLLLVSSLCQMCAIEEICVSLGVDFFGVLTGQIGNTLIVLSLTSVLSENFGQAYWVDIKESKLIAPFWGCFIGITVNLLSALVYSVIAFAIGFKSGVIVSALVATMLLVILTFKMISIYFGKAELKKQLKIEYKKMLILSHTSYVTDYYRRLIAFCGEVEKQNFPKKNSFIKNLRKEIKKLEADINSKDEKKVDVVHKEHIKRSIESLEGLKSIDLKILEYTKNAIKDNHTEVVRENVELLVECENYSTFFDLLDELFEWDEKYACSTLKKLSEKNKAWLIKDKMIYFKQNALRKLISESGKLDVIQTLLLIYDASNLGMKNLKGQLKDIKKHSLELLKEKTRLENEFLQIDNLDEMLRKTNELSKQIENESVQLKEKLLNILANASVKELRSFYVPIKEAILAYNEGEYSIVNKFLQIILINFEQDRSMIEMCSGIFEVDVEITYTFSYVTDDEMFLIDQLIIMDEKVMAIPEEVKSRLSCLDKVIITNNPTTTMNEESVEIFRSAMDLPKGE